MEKREQGLLEIYNRVKNVKDAFGIKAFFRAPTDPITQEVLPCIFMIEDNDEIQEYTARGGTGYPAKRKLEVVLEMVAVRDYDIKQLYRDVRTAVFTGGPLVAEGTFIREIRAEGPAGYDLPDVIGMRLVLALFYNDPGT